MISIKQLLQSFFPITSRQYWYFSSYFCLFLFIPFINILIKNLSKSTYKKLVYTILIVFCSIGWFSILFNTDAFTLSNGYSFVWLMALYFIGAYIKIYEKDLKKDNMIKNLFLYILFILLAFLISTVIEKIKVNITGNIGYRSFMISYISPFIVSASIHLFLYFRNLKIEKYNKIITNISSMAFAVFLIHCHPLVYNNYISNNFTKFTHLSLLNLLLIIVASALLIYVTSTIIEYIRVNIFRKLHVNEFVEKNFTKYLKKILEKF